MSETITASEVLRNDAFEIFGVLALEPSLQHIAQNQGKLSDQTLATISRIYRKLARLFHPDSNQNSKEDPALLREAFEKVKDSHELLQNSLQTLKLVQKKLGGGSSSGIATAVVAQQAARTKAQEAGEKLSRKIAAERELRKQQQQKAANELQANLAKMAGDSSTTATSATSSSSSSASFFERERRAQMSEWEIMEEEMLQDWDVDSLTLGRKENDLKEAMEFLKDRISATSSTSSSSSTAIRRNRDDL